MERIKQAIEKAKQQEGSRASRARQPQLPSRQRRLLHKARSVRSAIGRPGSSSSIRATSKNNRIVALNKSDLNSVSFDLLRTQVLQKMEENGWRTLAIVSPVPECGKTVVAINLAMSIAHHTTKTAMLVDFDLRKPKVGEYLGLPDGKIAQRSAGRRSRASATAFVNPGMPRLVVVPTSSPVRNSTEVLASQQGQGLGHDLRDRYEERIVIFDLPPLLNVDDAIALLPQIDCALVVVGNGMVTQAEMDESLHQLKGTNLLGVILNKAEVQQRNYYY